MIRGMAEPEMCIPHMKRLAEQRVDRIIETSPNGIVVLDEHLRILHMNPAFQKFFMCSEALCGQPIACLMDPEPFERLASGQEQHVEMTVEHKKYGLVCHQILYPLREESQYVGIMVNITQQPRQPAEARSPAVADRDPGPRTARTPDRNGPAAGPVPGREHGQGRGPCGEADAFGGRGRRKQQPADQPMAAADLRTKVACPALCPHRTGNRPIVEAGGLTLW